MQSNQPSVFMRDDTLLGVCEAIGEDFGFNPFYLRVALGVTLIFMPVAVIAGYLVAGVVVAFSRLVFPKARRRAGTSVQLAAETPNAVAAEAEPLAVAA